MCICMQLIFSGRTYKEYWSPSGRQWGSLFTLYHSVVIYISNLGTSSASLSLTSYPSEKVAMQILGWFHEPLDFNTYKHSSLEGIYQWLLALMVYWEALKKSLTIGSTLKTLTVWGASSHWDF